MRLNHYSGFADPLAPQIEVPDELGGLSALDRAIYATVAYRDAFDYPVTAEEIHHFLIGRNENFGQIEDALKTGGLIPRFLVTGGGYYALAGRDRLFELRRAREQASQALWRKAGKYVSLIASVPFVRMLAVTGSLAVNNVSGKEDIDLLIVTRPGCLWRTRILIKLLQLVDHKFGGGLLCPNYFLTERSLVLTDRRLYVAQELAQMVPVWGNDVYHRMAGLNGWTARYLPNARQPLKQKHWAPRFPRLKRFGEILLGNGVGARIENWEAERKIARYSANGYNHGKFSAFTRESTGVNIDMAKDVEAAFTARAAPVGFRLEEL